MEKISRLQYITQGLTEEAIIREVEEMLEAGIDWIQLRIKNDGVDIPAVAETVKEMCAGWAKLIINDRVDIAVAIDADGVHLGQEDMPVEEARSLLGPDKIIGGTANTLVQCKNLELNGVDYIGLGPFTYTDTKKKLSPVLGLEGIARIVPKEVPYGWMLLSLNVPVVAIGGITPQDVPVLLEQTGIHGIAVSGMLAKAENKKVLINELKQELYGSVEDCR